MDPVNKLCKWRRLFMIWQLGQRPKGDPEADAVVDHRELTMLMRAELNALTAMLIQKAVFTQVEFTAQVHVECEHLSDQYAKKFPGFDSAEDGLTIDLARARETMQRIGYARACPQHTHG